MITGIDLFEKMPVLNTRLIDLGFENVKLEIEKRLGYSFEEVRPFEFAHTGDRYGWVEGEKGNYHFTLLFKMVEFEILMGIR